MADPQPLNRQRVFDGKVFAVDRDEVRMPHGRDLTVDVIPGRGSGFSVEAPEGVRFLIRSRLMTEAELAAFGIEPPRIAPVVPTSLIPSTDQ